MTEMDITAMSPPRDDRESSASRQSGGPPNGTGEPAPVSFSRRIVRLTLSPVTARLGIAWIALMAILAVFAPLLANSFPIAVKMDGKWSSPMLQYLTPADVSLQVAFWSAVVLWFLRKRLSFRTRVVAFLGCLAVGITLSTVFVSPPAGGIIYHTYRRAAAEGRVEAVINAPIAYSPEDHQFDRNRVALKPPSGEHIMGTLSEKNDLCSNMIYATRIALSIGFVATGVAVICGVLMGAAMGYFGGVVDLLGMRLVEIFESVPSLLLLLLFAGLFQRPGPEALYFMMAIIGFLQSFSYAEFLRAEFLTLRNRDFVHAAVASGLPTRSVIFKHLLPNGLTPIIVNASFGVASAILTESTLSFLGIGLKGDASWGALLAQATSAGEFHWFLALYPGLAIFVTVFAYNLIGESLRDAMDPRMVRTQ